MALIYVVDITEGKEPDRRLIAMLPENRIKKLERYVHSADRLRCYAAGLTAMLAAAALFSCNVNDVALVTENGEAPYAVVEGNKKAFLGISHSGRYVICTADFKPCGCDVEEIGEIADCTELARGFYSKNETDTLLSIGDEEERRRMFFTLWTAKEAYLKYLGIGLRRSLSSFSVSADNDRLSVCDHERANVTPSGFTLNCDSDYSFSFFTESHAEDVMRINLGEVENYFILGAV